MATFSDIEAAFDFIDFELEPGQPLTFGETKRRAKEKIENVLVALYEHEQTKPGTDLIESLLNENKKVGIKYSGASTPPLMTTRVGSSSPIAGRIAVSVIFPIREMC